MMTPIDPPFTYELLKSYVGKKVCVKYSPKASQEYAYEGKLVECTFRDFICIQLSGYNVTVRITQITEFAADKLTPDEMYADLLIEKGEL